MKATPDAKPDDASTAAARRGGPSVQPQSPATKRPIPTVLPVDETTDVTPHERRMLEAMKAATSEQFQYIRQMAKQFEDAVSAGLDVAVQRETDFSVGNMCSYMKCGKPCLSPNGDTWAPKRCSGCQGNYYCSEECQTRDWKPISGRSTTQPGCKNPDKRKPPSAGVWGKSRRLCSSDALRASDSLRASAGADVSGRPRFARRLDASTDQDAPRATERL
ncbi:hypothetical protein C8F04DRAFT_1401940 [Mycena alexandri]|uniref:MYND-type domain-containing protein n=1 Tax=Mycena alexandri TaxID=1745969 RepID=A0AAD6WQ55_9AGAR|nr:hypothetical protein C8F04DRAFT_1401940 [Mycena alexandri]